MIFCMILEKLQGSGSTMAIKFLWENSLNEISASNAIIIFQEQPHTVSVILGVWVLELTYVYRHTNGP